MFALAAVGLGLFFHLEFPTTALRHQAAFYLLFIIVMWLDRLTAIMDVKWPLKPLQSAGDFVGRHKEAVLTLVLVLQVCMAYPEIKKDLRTDYSPARRLAQFLKHDPALAKAVVIPEPDTFAEALPYYAHNPIYIAREKRFEKCTRFTTESQGYYSLTELVADSRKIKDQTGQPVVILMGHTLSMQGPFKIVFSLGTRKVFTYTPESLKAFYDQTVKVASFHQTLTDEEYDVYLLK
jgi:hypothetical protein